MTQRVDVHVDDGSAWLNQLVTNQAMRAKVWEKASAGRTVTIGPAAPPAPKPPAASVFSGKGVFTTSNVGSCAGLNAAWTAIQKDPEGDHTEAVVGRLVFWQARPTAAVLSEAVRRGIPYIGQAESDDQLATCLELWSERGGIPQALPRALVGDPSAWSFARTQQAAAQGWELCLEFYKNAQPWLTAPDAHNYPLFRNVVFGTYDASGEHPGVGTRIPLADYRKIWPGPFSCWPAETMTDDDRRAFNAA